jgi:YspA, cpYpsA-related SLOG family
MRTIIAGSRDITNIMYLHEAIVKCGWQITKVISGGARGVDMLGEAWAFDNGIDFERYPANWAKYKLGAGRIRNAIMAENADALLALWDGHSKGTGNMIDIARAKNLKTYVHLV